MSREGYRGGRGARLGRGPYGNPIGGGFLGSRWYRRYPYYYSTYPYPMPYYNYPYGNTWYPPGYAGCPLTRGCLSSPYVYP